MPLAFTQEEFLVAQMILWENPYLGNIAVDKVCHTKQRLVLKNVLKILKVSVC